MNWLRLLSLLLVGLLIWVARPLPRPAQIPTVTLQVQQLLGSSSSAGEKFAPVTRARTFHFPEDHEAHRDFRSEWWYVTGNLEAEDGRPFGFQLTFFRQAMKSPAGTPTASAWRGDQLYMAHFTLCDIRAGKFYSHERFSREALGLAGCTSPLRVWLEDWSFEQVGPDNFRLAAQVPGTSLSLDLKAVKPPVLQGDAGLSHKGPVPGQASYYYSLPRLEASGKLGTSPLEGGATLVKGVAWLDREWSSRSLPPELQGWDWFCLQMQDNTELMFYRLRRPDGSATAESAGSFVDAAGQKTILSQDNMTLTPTRWWSSPVDGTRYPLGWKLTLKGRTYNVKPRYEGQELNLAVRYWEGAVEVESEGVKGVGFLELVGYPPPKK